MWVMPWRRCSESRRGGYEKGGTSTCSVPEGGRSIMISVWSFLHASAIWCYCADVLKDSTALAVLEAVVRHLPGALGNTESVAEESFSEGLEGKIEYPHYTRPREYEGLEVPAVLLSGDHGAVSRWRRENARPSPWRQGEA